MSKAFDKIAGGLHEALAVARGDAKPFKLHIPAEIDVKAIRQSLDMTREDFASSFGFTSTQIRDWEQSKSRPLGGNRAYLLIIKSDAAVILNILRERSKHLAAA